MSTILVIDDQPHMEELFSGILAQEGHTVLSANDVTSAKKRLIDSAIDLVLLDLYLDGFQGWELLTYIKDIKPKLPVIIVTAYDNYKDDPRLALADGYAVKSFSNLSDLKEKISLVLENSKDGQL